VKRVLSGKTSEFIAENIDYTLGLFDKSESQQVDFLREQAMKDVVANDDVPLEQEIIAESVGETGSNDVKSMYLNELSKY
jgi:hypothetical protein